MLQQGSQASRDSTGRILFQDQQANLRDVFYLQFVITIYCPAYPILSIDSDALLEAPKSTLDWDRVDGILRYLDTLELPANSHNKEVRANIQNFGVFSLCQGPVDNNFDAATPCISRDCGSEECEMALDSDLRLMDPGGPYENCDAEEAAWNLCNLYEQQVSVDVSDQQVLVDSGASSSPSIHSHHTVQVQGLDPELLALPNNDADDPLTRTYSTLEPLKPPLETLVVPSQERPWKTIHLPRVLQSAGELSFGGTTTRIRAALKNSLLSISAFYLSNDHRAHNRNQKAGNWATVASRYRCDAIGLLKHAVEIDLYADERPRYKEFLATMVSMVTINNAYGQPPAFREERLYIEEDESPSMMQMVSDGVSSEAQLSAYECIYGIPQSLLLLLKESIEVIDELNFYRTNADMSYVPENLSRKCDELEQRIMDWPIEESLRRHRGSGSDTASIIIYHQTRAFLNALIIFFSQSVTYISHRYLRQYVLAILDSIEAIEQLKAETKILAAPLFWPAFMGATEAFDPQHQERFRQWYRNVEVYGIEVVRTGIQLLHEVWRLGPASNQMPPRWRSVLEIRRDCLMLT
ncbi:uncharacterized protein TRUGW13939_05094 [Talaromyces rugulosus]|uniref:Uncharacterized protein n=1 Tax=Talaromyces rugulosus TaxID=121627 RepID=A0A7H8QVC7_TALRU|nr:uncharacterized protein TRUGW13939_05094 [Talaromyces rugulosus]QKX57974.1 hypothetical protein TRUGW13939_05094 [Talaromyces rugulosus]